MSDPYALLGLSRNPFVAEQEPGVAHDLWLDRGFPSAPEPGQRVFVQLVGPRGAGKTSLLLRWRGLSQAPYHYAPPDHRRWALPPLAQLVYWDEADRIPLLPLALALASLHRATVVVGTHTDLRTHAKRCGFQVQTVCFAALDAPTLLHWANRRIDAARLPSAPCPLVLDDATSARIAAAAGASWRIAADQLHVWAADAAARALKECASGNNSNSGSKE
jgi:hypothetical protein